jgi:cytochrome c nitrite reductase small subunit
MVLVKSRRFFLVLLLALSGTAVLLIFLLLGPPRLLARSEHPDFCAGCHVMEAEYDAWAHTGAHRRKACVDCHLPNDNAGIHYVWKAIDGMKDVALFYSGSVPDRITITEHGKKVLQANCIRCHAQTVMNINQERPCWECHRRIMHARTGAMQTI